MNWLDGLFGYDVFIAHRRADGAVYADRLHQLLQQHKISSFLDKKVYLPGDSLRISTRRHAGKSTLLILVGSPEIAVPRKPVDWVEQEIVHYLETHLDHPKLIVLDFGSMIANSALGELTQPTYPIAQKVAEFVLLPGDLSALDLPPSEAVLDIIRRNLTGRRREQARRSVFQAATAVLVVLVLVSGSMGGLALQKSEQSKLNKIQSMTTDSLRLASESTRELNANHADVAALLAWSALAEPLMGFEQPRPYTVEAAVALVRALSYRPIATDVLRYPSGIQFAVPNPSNNILLVVTEDGAAELRSIDGLKLLTQWQTRQSIPQAGSFSPDGQYIAIAAHDGSIKLWAANGGQEIRTLNANSPLRSVAFNANGSKILGSGDDGNSYVWMMASGEKLAQLKCSGGRHRPAANIQPAAFHPTNEQVVIACEDGYVETWQVADKVRQSRWPGLIKAPRAIGYSPNGKLLAIGTSDGTLQIRQATDGTILHTISAHDAGITSMAFSQDNRSLLTTSDDRTAMMWNVQQGNRLNALHGHTFYVRSAFLSGNQQAITASWDKTVRVWQLGNDEIQRTLEGVVGGVSSMSLSDDDGTVLAGSWDDGAFLFDGASGSIRQHVAAGHSVGAVAISKDGLYFATVGGSNTPDDGLVQLWRSATGKLQYTLPVLKDGVASVTFSPDGKGLLVGGGDGSLRVWSTQRTSQLFALPVQEDAIGSAEFDPQGDRIVTATSNGVIVWNVASKQQIATLPTAASYVAGATFDGSGRRILVRYYDGALTVFDSGTTEAILQIPKSTVGIQSAEFNRDGSRIVVAHEDGSAIIWDTRTGRPIEAYTAAKVDAQGKVKKGLDKAISIAKFSADGRLIFLGTESGSVMVWRPTAGALDTLKSQLPKYSLTSAQRLEFGLN
ncbi:toll/interleukin-1 receptor domain-containing protein [Undibacterium sp. Ji42W]|uniref:toll/interleukin-1 receptor domain-containing protein n=1 Tax=Undibacterium sp. Ji42W TaxID=3413039 RepID=UPI003BEF7362